MKYEDAMAIVADLRRAAEVAAEQIEAFPNPTDMSDRCWNNCRSTLGELMAHVVAQAALDRSAGGAHFPMSYHLSEVADVLEALQTLMVHTAGMQAQYERITQRGAARTAEA